MFDAFLAGSTGTSPRLGLSRSIYVAPTRAEALAEAEPGLRESAARLAQRAGRSIPEGGAADLAAHQDAHIGSPDDVIASLKADPLLTVASDLILQVHPMDPSPELTLRSFQLIAAEVLPALRG
jgi:alkanesulfonate monooxygenase SsuD/methylene tetrahydromethanopterin reductase-like flavin-dependent oxidoreductase (luciferase family)